MNPENTVFVSNISLKANTKTVSDFFSFCGKIVNLVLRNDSLNQGQQALVIFETDSAAKTALLLTNALIVDKVIQVIAYNPTEHGVLQPPNPDAPQSPNEYHSEGVDQITQREQTVPDSERSKTSIIASVIAAGYSVGQDALGTAKSIDEEHMISLKLKVGAEAVKAKANEINNKLHISENASAIKSAVVEKAKVVDERFGVSGLFSRASDFLSQQGNALVAKVNDENAIYSPFVQKVSDIGSSIKKEFQEISEETEKAIDEKKRERGIVDENNNNNVSVNQSEQQLQQQPSNVSSNNYDYQQQPQQQEFKDL